MSVTAAAGFVASGVHARIRRERKDLAVVRSLPRATGAAMWTQNRVLAAPVVVSKAHLELAQPQAIVINSGVANALTGERGELDALCTAAEAARLLDLDAEEVLVLSTGVIGAPLPLDRVRAGLVEAAAALSTDGGADAADAILTTDTRPKTRGRARLRLHRRRDGEGQRDDPSRPGDDARRRHDRLPAAEGEAIDFLRPAVEGSFNTISVDGECSTNDAVVLLSSGAAAVERTPASDEAFALALRRVCTELSAQIVADGEGATLVAEIAVTGAASDAEARAIARRIATSPLVKTALFGRDANWGRILAAAGSAPYNGGYARVETSRLSLSWNGTAVLGRRRAAARRAGRRRGRATIALDLGLGDAAASYLTSDLSYEYVRINAEYRS